MSSPRILVWDLETVGLNSFKADMAVIVVFGYKWYGEDEVHTITIDEFRGWWKRGRGLSDGGLCRRALSIMNEADLLVAHYGDKFDRRFFNGRMVANKLPPPPDTKQRDTCLLARRYFSFSNNRLDTVARAVGAKHRKMDKKDGWPDWWLRTLAGSKEDILQMAEYCKDDVLTLEDIYSVIRIYDTNHPRMHGKEVCRQCGSANLHFRPNHFAYVGENRYRRFQCLDCQKWDRQRVAVK